MSSWFGGAQSKLDMEAVEAEYTVVNELFQRVQETCRSKCVDNEYLNGEISKGESTCLDRCVIKYLATANKIAQESRNRA